jgi:hypothetical protein
MPDCAANVWEVGGANPQVDAFLGGGLGAWEADAPRGTLRARHHRPAGGAVDGGRSSVRSLRSGVNGRRYARYVRVRALWVFPAGAAPGRPPRAAYARGGAAGVLLVCCGRGAATARSRRLRGVLRHPLSTRSGPCRASRRRTHRCDPGRDPGRDSGWDPGRDRGRDPRARSGPKGVFQGSSRRLSASLARAVACADTGSARPGEKTGERAGGKTGGRTPQKTGEKTSPAASARAANCGPGHSWASSRLAAGRGVGAAGRLAHGRGLQEQALSDMGAPTGGSGPGSPSGAALQLPVRLPWGVTPAGRPQRAGGGLALRSEAGQPLVRR